MPSSLRHYRTPLKRLALSSSSALLALSYPHTALAHNFGDDAAQDNSPGQRGQDRDGNGNALPNDRASTASDGDIIVTANRTSSLASKTPIALTAVTGEQLREQGITNPTLLARSVPNLSIDRNNGLQITIRGVTSTDNTEKGDPSAAFLLDGVYLARPQAQETSFFDIERVEVLRGPQGTLYGRNTTAGVINVIPVRPKDKFEASIDAVLGDYSTQQLTGIVNIPITDGIAIRAGGNIDRRDSFVINGQSRYNFNPGKDNYSARLATTLDVIPNVKILLRADYSELLGSQKITVLTSNFFRTPFSPPPANALGIDPQYIGGSSDERRTQRYADASQQHLDQKNFGTQGQVDWSLAKGLDLTYLGAYRYFRQRNRPAAFGGRNPVTGVPFIYPQTLNGTYRQNSQELRLAYKDSRLTAQGGFYYFHERAAQASLSYGRITPVAGTRGYVFGFPGVTTSRSMGLFGQATYSILSSLRFTAGIRNTWDTKQRVGATVYHVNVDDPLDFTTGPNTAINPGGYRDSLNNARVRYSKATWRLGFDYDLAPNTLLFATVSTGYKAGGFNDGCTSDKPNCNAPIPAAALYYQPETVTSYEAGIKTKLFDRRLGLNVDYFHYDYNNLQLSQQTNLCGGPCQVTTNAAKAKVDGVEVEGNWRVGANGQFNFAGTYLNARYANYVIVPGASFAGRPLDRSPAWTGSVGYTQTMPLTNGGSVAAGFHTFASTSYRLISTALRAQFRQPGYTKTDLTLTYNAPQERWYVQAFVRNLENEVTLQSASALGTSSTNNDGLATFSDPRTFGIGLGAKF